jgi:hypothetical protein
MARSNPQPGGEKQEQLLLLLWRELVRSALDFSQCAHVP